jgi:hypothetical protein
MESHIWRLATDQNLFGMQANGKVTQFDGWMKFPVSNHFKQIALLSVSIQKG